MRSKSDIVRSWYVDIWMNKQWDDISKFYHPAPNADCLLPSGSNDPFDLKELIIVLDSLICDKTISVLKSVEQGDWVSSMVEMRGFKTGTTNAVCLRWMTLLRIDGDYIVEAYPTINFIDLFQQLGQLPDSTTELLLSGTRLG
ncbi:MAG: nuclear transport factor 2 family protein [Roseobacter sp.]